MNYIDDITPYAENGLYNVVIETPAQSHIQYEIHSNGKYLVAKDCLNLFSRDQYSKGFMPRTMNERGFGLKVMVLGDLLIFPLSVVPVKVLGYFPITCGEVQEARLLAVPFFSDCERIRVDRLRSSLFQNLSDEAIIGEYVEDPQEVKKIIQQAHEKYVLTMSKDLGRGKEKVDAPVEEQENILEPFIEVEGQFVIKDAILDTQEKTKEYPENKEFWNTVLEPYSLGSVEEINNTQNEAVDLTVTDEELPIVNLSTQEVSSLEEGDTKEKIVETQATVDNDGWLV